MGGDVGIALVTTFLARRAQAHQSFLTAHTSAADAAFQARLRGAASTLLHGGASAVDASHRAMALAYGEVIRQATTLAYLDVLRAFGVLAAIMVPLLLLTRPPKKGQTAPAH
jgi:DHA2 family multidrug resistance protein